MKVLPFQKKTKELWEKHIATIDKEKLKLSPKMFTFLFFVVLSTLLWFLNALSREYADEIRFPVKYSNYPEGMVLLNEPPQKLKLMVESYGYSLFMQMLTPSISALEIDFSKTPLRVLQDGDTLSYFIETDYLQNELSDQLQSDIKLKSAKPDSLIFTFTKTISKKVPVQLQQQLNFQKPFQLKGKIRIRPDSAIIEGPQAIIQTIDLVPSQKLRLDKLAENYSGKLNLLPMEYVYFSEDKIEVEIETEKYTEGKLNIPFRIKNLPDTLDLNIFPRNLLVHYTAGLADYRKVKPEDFEAVLDYTDVQQAISNRIPVHLIQRSKRAKIQSYQPKLVEFILKRKQAER